MNNFPASIPAGQWNLLSWFCRNTCFAQTVSASSFQVDNSASATAFKYSYNKAVVSADSIHLAAHSMAEPEFFLSEERSSFETSLLVSTIS